MLEFVNNLLAQASGGPDINLPTLIPGLGFSAIFLWQWLDERKERRQLQAAISALFERLLPVLEEATSTLERVQGSMEKQVEKVERAGPTPNEMAVALRRLEDLADEFGRGLRRPDSGEERRR